MRRRLPVLWRRARLSRSLPSLRLDWVHAARVGVVRLRRRGRLVERLRRVFQGRHRMVRPSLIRLRQADPAGLVDTWGRPRVARPGKVFV